MDDDWKILENCRCKDCVNYRHLYLFDGEQVVMAPHVACAANCNIKECDGMGCFQFKKNPNPVYLDRFKPMQLLLKLRLMLKDVKELLNEIDNLGDINKS